MRTLGVLIAAAIVVLIPAAASAATPLDAPGREVTRWDETFTLNADGSVDVSLEIDFDFGDDPGHGPYLVLPIRQGYDQTYDRLYATTRIAASSPTGAPAGVNLEEGRSFLDLKIGDAAIGDVSGMQTYVITYTVAHVMNTTGSAGAEGVVGDEFYWNAVGDGWTIPISNATVTVVSPVAGLDAQCFAGFYGASLPCDNLAQSGTSTTFGQGYLEPGQPFTVDVLYPQGTFDTTPSLIESSDVNRAFNVNGVTGGGALAVLAGGLVILTRRLRGAAMDDQFAGLTPGLSPVGAAGATAGVRAAATADGTVVKRNYRTPVAVQFSPPPGLRPGQLGTLIDEKADSRDVTATMVDLAVRGYLRVEDSGQTSGGVFTSDGDYTLVKLRESDAALFPFEATLLDALFEGRSEVKLSDLSTTFSASLAVTQKQLYENVVLLGWFRRSPQMARAAWASVGVGVTLAGVMATLLLAQGTRLALIALPLIVLGTITVATTRHAPARTAAGTAVLEQTRGFELYVSKAEANQLRFEEGEDIFSKYLPYAIAFGVADTWAEKFEELARQGRNLAEPLWFAGGFAHGAFWSNAAGLGDRMSSFASFADTAMSAPTPGSSGGSGFSSSGGFSGGGGGGGGGGGW